MKHRRPILGLIAAVVGCSAGAASAQDPPALPQPKTVVVLQHIDTNYKDPKAIAPAVANALPAAATVLPSEGFQKLISRLYSVGNSNAPEAYDLIEGAIRSLNNLTPDAQLKAGQRLIVPDLPKIAPDRPGSNNPYDAIAKISVDVRGMASAATLIRPVQDRKLEDAQHQGAQSVTLIRNISVDDRNAAVAQKKVLLTINEPLQLHFLSGALLGPDVAGRPLSAADAAILRRAAAGPHRQQPVMIVFDESWPSLSEAEVSRAYVLSALRDLRAASLIPAMTAFETGCGLGQSVSSWPDGGDKLPHTTYVARSLETLQAAAGPVAPVKMVYIPLLAEHPCAKEVLGQLIEYHLLMRHRAGNTTAPTTANDAAQFHAGAQSILAALGTQSTADLGNSDAEVIQAVLNFAERLGRQPNVPVFTSMSWEFDLDVYELAVPPVLNGLFVVSAGNEGLDDKDKALPPVIETKVQFADRSVQPGDMLTVMNIGPDGHFACHSSVVDPKGGGFATSFPGDLGPKCGTSFSAPRVAWLLALRESTRPPLADPTMLGAHISADLKQRGLTGMVSGDPKPLDIAALFK